MQKILILLGLILFAGFDMAYACDTNQIDVLGDGTQCETAKFTITTTELEPDTEFKFYMSASGTFYVDWGDGTIDTITRTNTTETLYDHTYTTAGVKTIRFGGLATRYNENKAYPAIRIFSGEIDRHANGSRSSGTEIYVGKISGSVGAIFPTLGNSDYLQPSFYMAFHGLKNVTGEIPADLFSGVYGNTVPMMFFSVFYGSAFTGNIPSNLFSGVTTAHAWTFGYAFSNCSKLTGYIPSSLFAGLIANGSPYASYMMYSIFNNTNLATTCPTGTMPHHTGYEQYWGNKVSCQNIVPITCDVGKYFSATDALCHDCLNDNYCPGGTYTYDGTNMGLTACPAGTFAPAGMWEAAQCGRILHVGDGFVYLRATKKTAPSLHLDLDHDGIADYFGNMTTLDVPMSRDTPRKLKVRMNGTVYSIYDDSVELNQYQN